MIRAPPKLVRARDVKRYKQPTRVRKSKRSSRTYAILKCPRMPMPAMFQNVMSYSDIDTLTLTLGAVNTAKYVTNSLYDPNYTGTGTQPMYFDQLIAIYDHYTVVSSYIEVTILGRTTTPNQLIQVLYVDDDATVSTGSIQNYVMRPGARVATYDSTVTTPPVMRIGWSAVKTWGNPTPWNDAEIQGNSAASPIENSYFVVALEDRTIQTVTYSIHVKMTFNVVWDELKTITPS